MGSGVWPPTLALPRAHAPVPSVVQLLGEYGLRCKREIWRSQLALAKVRSAARKLLTLDEKDPKRMFEGDALIRRLVRYGVLTEDEKKLDDVLRLSTQRFLERRLQTKVLKMNYAKSIHHARVLIRQRHIRVGKQLVNSPQFLVRTDSEGHIDFSLHSPYNPSTGRPVSLSARRGVEWRLAGSSCHTFVLQGRVARKKAKAAKAEGGGDE